MKKCFSLIVVVAVLSIAACSGEKKKPAESKGEGDNKLSLMPIEDTTVTAGETAKIKVEIKRQGFDEPVNVQFEGLPEGVSTPEETTIDKGETQKTFTLVTKKEAEAVKNTVKVTAKAKDMKATKEFKFEVKKK